MATKKQCKVRAQADEIAKALAAFDHSDDIAAFGPKILALFAGPCGEAFRLIDERPGLFRLEDRFYLLRQIRNHPIWGRKLFAGFTD